MFGIANKRQLKPDAVPTIIFNRPSTSSAIAAGPSTGVRTTVQTRKRTSMPWKLHQANVSKEQPKREDKGK